jgi:mono/diheme cytochrome c family protein
MLPLTVSYNGIMKLRTFITMIVLAATLPIFAQQPAERPRVYTAEQAAAGQRELADNKFGTCSDCHAKSLAGRSGDKGEIPELGSLPDNLQTTIRNYGGRVPQLAGPKFLARWGTRSTKDFSWEMMSRFSDPLSEETQLNIMAYILQLNGALAGTQPLTRSTDIKIDSLIK